MNRIFLSLTCICIFVFQHARSQSPARPYDLTCEYLENPMGIDAQNPRLSWKIEDSRPGAIQTSYQLVVGTDSLEVAHGKGNAWQTEIIRSQNQLVTYSGKPLLPFTRYYWTVRTWDGQSKRSSGSAIARFETGMMSQQNWKGSWISDGESIDTRPAPYFRKIFTIPKKIRSARAYIAVAGLYELYINGQKIGDHALDPMYTRFDRRTLYLTHDITSSLVTGNNAIGVLLGNGWYNHQSTAVWFFDKAPWRGRPAFCLDIRITYTDGSVETISSGKDWKTTLSPVIFNSIYTAEHYDARLEIPDWNQAIYNDSSWKTVILRSAPSNHIVAQQVQPIRRVEKIPSTSMKKISDTLYVFDLGRNIAGISELTVTGKRGTTLRLKHGERLLKNGRVDQSNIDVHYRPTDDKDPFQTDIFILSGKGTEQFAPRFNYKGFQYVEISSSEPIELTKESLAGYFMHSDVPVAGEVESSSQTLNRIWAATNHSYLSNLYGYPTDCPQREKNGWTGDAHIASETGLYNFDGITVYEKWLADHRDEQQPNGVLPSIIPTGGWGYEWGNGPDWTSTIALIPWNIYLFYGDKKLLGDCYENIRRYVDHITEISPNGTTTWGLGDWVPVKSKTPVELTSTAYYYADALILSKTAALLGHSADATKYKNLADKIRKAFNDKFLDRSKGIYGSGVQTELSVPLLWGLVPEEMKQTVADNLARRVEADGRHIDVGLLGTKAILNALSENGHAELAYQVAAQEDFPGWGWWIVNGATTLYENWPINAQSDISMNHIMFGEIGAWYYKALAGIKPDERQPGFKNIRIEPHFVKGLNSFRATHESPYGKIASSWKRSGNNIEYSLTIPPNCTGLVQLPLPPGTKYTADSKTMPYTGPFKVVAGTYVFQLKESN